SIGLDAAPVVFRRCKPQPPRSAGPGCSKYVLYLTVEIDLWRCLFLDQLVLEGRSAPIVTEIVMRLPANFIAPNGTRLDNGFQQGRRFCRALVDILGKHAQGERASFEQSEYVLERFV